MRGGKRIARAEGAIGGAFCRLHSPVRSRGRPEVHLSVRVPVWAVRPAACCDQP